MKKTFLLCILDGFGLNPNPKGNAVLAAAKPNFDRLWRDSPHTTLVTYGERVGLPAGQMGNSEVGHLNIGAGRVVEQWLLRISRALSGNAMSESKTYATLKQQLQHIDTLHLVGLLSDGGVHSHEEHLKLLIQRVSQDFQGPIHLHVFTDGRDTAPKSGIDSVNKLVDFLKAYPRCRIASVCGRFYAMDRDKRWERTQKAYESIVLATPQTALTAGDYVQEAYRSTSDEFIEPVALCDRGIRDNDGIIFWNFREDRMRQIVAALATPDFSAFQRPQKTPPPENILCFTEYDHSHKLPYLFEPLQIRNHLGEFLSHKSLRQLRVAETEKYPHVTYFFNGGVEQPYPLEERQLVPSPRDVKTYDLKPEMSAAPVTDIVVKAIESGSYDIIVVNLANCDMVGHTGVFDAARKAVETVDACLGRMITALQQRGGQAIVIADHGNAEQMVDYETGAPFTSHTMYPVPCILFGAGSSLNLRADGALCDVAPTILKILEIAPPTEMSGSSLF